MNSPQIIFPEKINRVILLLRNQKVIIDYDLARLYNTTTKVINQATKRNSARFPADFMFQLTQSEKLEVVTKCDHLSALKFSSQLPYAFTEYGALMVATILNNQHAVEVSITIIKTFIQLRNILSNSTHLAYKLEELEQKYNKQFKIVFDALREIMTQPEIPEKPPIGFNTQ